MRTFLIRMNNTKPPFDNVNARKAFAHAFNYMGFINDILGGYATRDPYPQPETLWGIPKDAKGYDYDLKKAKEYAAKAAAEGAPMRRAFEIHVQSENEQSVQGAQLFQSDLAQIGINLKVVGNIWSNLTTAATKPETTPDMWVHWVSTYFVDPENWVGQMYDSQFHGTWKASAYYKNAEVDALLRKARATVKQEERAPLYEAATRQIMADFPDIWIYNSMQLQGINKRVKGRRFCTVGQGWRCDRSRSTADRMARFLLRRCLLVIPSLLGLLVVTFLLIHAVPSDPAVAMAGEGATPEQIARLRQQYGLDKPIWEQFAVYVGKVATLDFGNSAFSRRPVAIDILQRLPATLELTFCGAAALDRARRAAGRRGGADAQPLAGLSAARLLGAGHRGRGLLVRDHAAALLRHGPRLAAVARRSLADHGAPAAGSPAS